MDAKTQNLKVRNYSNFIITFPTIWRCAGVFFKVKLKSKIAATDHFHIFVGEKTQKLKVRNYSNFTITFPTVWVGVFACRGLHCQGDVGRRPMLLCCWAGALNGGPAGEQHWVVVSYTAGWDRVSICSLVFYTRSVTH